MATVTWLTGISGSGKTTLGSRLQQELKKKHKYVEFIDGDLVRDFFGNDLGYTMPERIRNIKRITFAAMMMAKNGTHVVVSNIAPYYEVRDFIRRHIRDYAQIYLKVSLEKAMERDVKGHYQSYKNGTLKNLIGVDDPYDVPRNPNLIVDTENEMVDDSLAKIVRYLETRGF